MSICDSGSGPERKGTIIMEGLEKKPRERETEEGTGISHKVAVVFGAVVCVILLPILVINIMLIVRSFASPNEVPSVGGIFPLVVMTDSMYPDIQGGDLIFCHTEEPENIKEGDVIAFFDPAGNGTSIVTHSVVEVTEKDGEPAWVTRGIANNANDAAIVPAQNLAGAYKVRLPGVGRVVMFLQTTKGLLICVVCPILLLVAWDVFRRRRYEKRSQADTEALLRELEELRARSGKQTEDSETTDS